MGDRGVVQQRDQRWEVMKQLKDKPTLTETKHCVVHDSVTVPSSLEASICFCFNNKQRRIKDSDFLSLYRKLKIHKTQLSQLYSHSVRTCEVEMSHFISVTSDLEAHSHLHA